MAPKAVLLLFLTLGSSAFTQTISITTGNWGTGSTWNTGSTPVNGSASVSGGNTVTFQAGDSYTGGYSMYTGLDVGQKYRTNPGSGILNVTGGTLRTGSLLVGHDSAGYGGTINVSGGEMIIDGGTMLFGWGASSSLNVSGSGTVTMVGTLDSAAPFFIFGHAATSFLNITSNGTVNIQRSVALEKSSHVNISGTNAALNINGGSLNVSAGSRITVQGGGAINLLSGTQTISTAEGFYLGNEGTTGTLNLSGGTWQQNNFLRMGIYGSGNGIINQTGGTFEMGGNFEAWGSSPSAYNLQGGTFRTTANGVAINNYSGGAMTFNITGSSGNVTMDTPYDFTVNNTSTFNNAAATLTKTGSGTLTFSGCQLQIANGALDMQDGTIETASSLAIGIEGSSATGTMSGGTLKTGYIQAANFIIGFGQTGTFTQSNGAVDVGSQANVVLGWTAGGNGTYTLSGGTVSAASNTYLGLGGAGTLNVNGGSYTASNMYVGGNGGTGALNLNGGTLTVNNIMTVGAGGTVNVNAGGSLSGGSGNDVTVANNGLVNFNGGTGNSSMNLKLGGGTVDLSGQTLGAESWANLCATTVGAVLKNSSATAASIAAGNTIWIWDAATNLTIDTTGLVQIDSRITSSGQPNPTGIIKTGANTLILTAADNDYTGTTAINEGRLILADGNALGSTSGGTIVASGAQLSLNGITVGAEPLTISGTGTGTSAGALRARTGSSTWQGKVTLAADAMIFSGSGTSLTLDVASGSALDLSGFTLTIDGAGTNIINDGITGTGGITKNGSGTATLAGSNTYSGTTTVSLGTLVVSNSTLTATILPASTTVNFTAPPAAGTYPVLSGPVGSASLTSITVNNLGGKTATVANSPNLVVQVTDAPTGPTFDSLYTPGSENGLGSNGLPNLMNYALGGTGPSSNPALPVLTSNASSLRLTANIRNSGQGVVVIGQYAYDLAGPWNDVALTPTGASSSVANTTVQSFTQAVESGRPKIFMRFKVTKQ